MNDSQRMVESDTADAMTWEEGDEVVEIEVKRPLEKIIPVRLTAEKWLAIREEARGLGIGPSTLARMWILEKLRQTARKRPPS